MKIYVRACDIDVLVYKDVSHFVGKQILLELGLFTLGSL